ncbi:MAG: hypothetical protein HYS27_25515 [Deltaproteobacteria bacterium]|nr:hypothetical protein [Deltaproteobacteria bacterium]
MTRPAPSSPLTQRSVARPAVSAATLAAAALVATALVGACPARDASVTRRTLYFAGEPVARIEERALPEGAGRRVTRAAVLEDTAESTELVAVLDAHGFARQARYTRGKLRSVALDALSLPVASESDTPVVLIDLLGHVQPPAATAVSLVDLSSAEVVLGSVERRGAEIVALDRFGGVVARANVEGHRTGPGVFFEGDSASGTPRQPVEVPSVDPRGVGAWRLLGVDDVLPALAADGPGQRRVGDLVVRRVDPPTETPTPLDTGPQPFVESSDERLVAWATALRAPDDPLARAVRLVEAIHPLVDASKRALPPSAVVMLEHGGDCDGAAALLAAGLRALGTAARPVVGYRWADGRFAPHAWTEVHTPGGWVLVDAAAARVGDDATYLKLFEGLGGALTMGRVLGRLHLQPAAAPGAP